MKKSSDDEDGEMGDIGDETNEMERPKCLTQFNFNSTLSDR